MEHIINKTPFQVKEIAAKLFNLDYLSDITFLIEGKKIFAHSLILMVRSSVFQEQLETTMSEKKIIPITDYKYDEFYQFIKFIYTDQIDVNSNNKHDLLKLAIHYNVIRLVNELMNRFMDSLQMLDFYKAKHQKIDLNRTSIKLQVACYFKRSLNSDLFVSIDSDVLEEILKFDEIEEGVTEFYILEALIRWMNHHCQKNQIQFIECRKKFAHLIQLIRFPTMSSEELRTIKTKYSDLLTESDFLKFAGLKIYGAASSDGIWNCSPRKELVDPYEFKEYQCKSEFEIKFSVSSDMMLGGFAVGLVSIFCGTDTSKYMNITISCQNRDMIKVAEININEVRLDVFFGLINLGTSIRVCPDFIYTIECKFLLTDETIELFCREPQTELIIIAPPNSVKILKAHSIMFEITFIQP